jgi:hypothetical protein
VFEISEDAEVEHRDGEWVRVSGRKPLNRPSWHTTQKQQMPTGKFGLHAYAPFSGLQWSRYWRETEGARLSERFEDVAATLEGAAPEIERLTEQERVRQEEYQRKSELEHRAWEKQERERQRAEALKVSRDELLGMVENWARATRIETFFADVSRRAAELPPAEKEQLERKLAAARDLFGGPDAMKRFLGWKSPEER